MKKLTLLALSAAAVGLTGCASLTGGKRIVRISHAQAETHPEHRKRLIFRYDRKNPRLLFSSRSTLTIHI